MKNIANLIGIMKGIPAIFPVQIVHRKMEQL